MAFACLPIADVEILIIVVALAEAFTEAFSPRSMILVVCAFLLVGAVEYALAVTLVVENFSFVEISIEVGYLCYLMGHLVSSIETKLGLVGSCC